MKKKMDETEKKCRCGRIITDPKDKTGLCPKCRKGVNNILAGVGAISFITGVKKYGPKLLKNAISLAKNLKK